MTLKSFFFYIYSKWLVRKENRGQEKAISIQNLFLKRLISANRKTLFGMQHDFEKIKNYEDFIQYIPMRHYEDFIPYMDKIKKGEEDVLMIGKPLYLLMTSGTSAGSKYIPLSKEGIKNQINAAMKLLCFHSVNIGNANFMNFQMIFIQGSPELLYEYKIPCGRLSGVVYHHVPKFFQRNKLPNYKTNVISNWQEKINQIVEDTLNENLSIIGGIPPWCIQYFEKLIQKTKKNNLQEIFPNLSLYIHGGLDFSSYKENTKRLLGENIYCLQTFPASEGFFAIQDELNSDDMLLLVNQGVFYEFIPIDEIDKDHPRVISLEKVAIETSYELLITNDSGLWRYRMGDLIQFTNLFPYRIKVVGRTSQYISAFGEHVIGYEIEQVMELAVSYFKLNIEEYHVSPNVEDRRYEWRIEWKDNTAVHYHELSIFLDRELSKLNKYYAHLIEGHIIHSSMIISVEKGTFKALREKSGKEGGQNKVIRLSNDNFFSTQLSEIQFKK